MAEEYISRKAARDVLSALAIRHFELTDLFKIYIKALEDADDEIVKLPAEDVAPVARWVSVKTQLPLGGEQVLICLQYPDGNQEVTLGEYWDKADGEEHGWGGFGGNGVVTHWVPLPGPPKEVSE